MARWTEGEAAEAALEGSSAVTKADAIEQLDRLPFAWSCAKGRLRLEERDDG